MHKSIENFLIEKLHSTFILIRQKFNLWVIS